MRRCTLCGGKLDGTKRCTLCGLDNTKNDDIYKHRVNKNVCDDLPLTHVHEEPVRTVPKKPIKTAGYAPTYQAKKKTGNKAKSAGCFTTVITLIPIIIAAIGILSSFISDFGSAEPAYIANEEMYATVTIPEDWEEDGYYYNTSLKEGTYIVGVDIPAGYYEIRTEEYCEGCFDIYYYEEDVFVSEYVFEDDVYEVLLKNQSELIVWEDSVILLETDSAQPLMKE